jgi:DNA invertase Pin-like site-specific DNA recombinase
VAHSGRYFFTGTLWPLSPCTLGVNGWYIIARKVTLGAIAQFETEIRAERQMDGIQKAQASGVQFGVKSKLTDEQITDLRQRRQNGELIRELMKDFGISKATVYRYLDPSP